MDERHGDTRIGALRELRGKVVKRARVGSGTFQQDTRRIGALETIAAAVEQEREKEHEKEHEKEREATHV